MKKVFSFVKGKKDDRRDNKINPPISVEITNPSGQKITSDDEHILGLQQGYGYNIDLNGKDKNLPKLHKSVWVGNLEKVKIHLKKCDINTVDSLNRTPLHFAVAQGHTEIVWYLLNNNASMDACDSEGLAPFLKAIECGNKDCVNLLIECGVNVSCTDRNGNNGLHLASKHGFYNIATLLLKEGVTLDLANNVGEYPLHIATGCEHRELVELLLSSGGNVEVLDRERRTPLMIAARSGFLSIIKVLLDSGATLEAADSNGWTAEDYAQFGGHQDLVEILKTGQKDENPVEQSERLSVQSSDTSENVPQPSPQNLPDRVGEDQQDSPRSCVTPPALEPPRSWDLIQSGAIDQGAESRRRNFMSLGSLRSHQEGPSDGNNDGCNKNQELSSMMLPSPTGDQVNLENRLSPVPATTPERRTRSPLERANSLDLPSDQDSPLGLDCGLYSPDEVLPAFKDLWESSPKYPAAEQNKPCVENNLVCSSYENNNNFTTEKVDNVETMVLNINETVKETTKTNVTGIETECSVNENYVNITTKENNKILVDTIKNGFTAERISSTEMSDSFDNTNEKSSGTENFYAGASCSMDNLEDTHEKRLSIEIIQSTGKLDDTLSVCTMPIKSKFRESHSLDLLETTDCDDLTRSARGRKHSRNKSITLSGQPQLWRSVDALPKPSSLGGADIDAQLQCYDEALRQLANESIAKKNPTQNSQILEPDIDNKNGNNIQDLEPCRNAVCNEVNIVTEPQNPPPPLVDSKSCEIAEIDRIENEPTSLETDKEDSFPPPPKCFMENEDDITQLNSVEILNNTLPITKLTPIKETYLELDSLTSNMDAQDSDNMESSVSRFELTPRHFDVEVIVNDKCPTGFNSGLFVHEEDNMSENTLENIDSRSSSSTVDYNDPHKNTSLNIVSCHLDGGDLFLTDQLLPEYYDRYFVDVKTLQFKPNEVDFNRIVIPPDSPSPKLHKVRRGMSEAQLEPASPRNTDARHLTKCSSLNFDIGGMCNVSKSSSFVQANKSDSVCDGLTRPLRTKRNILAAMRSPGMDSKNEHNPVEDGNNDDEEDNESTDDDPPFWQNTDKGGQFIRQETVVTVLPAAQTPRNTPCGIDDGEVAGTSSERREGEKESTSPSSDAETVSVADTPKHTFATKSHQSVLQAHLREATIEKGRLEEAAASLREKAERLKYELADARQAEIARDDTIAILQTQLKRLEDRYTKAQEDLCTLRQRATNAEHELQHLRQLCSTLKEEKEELSRELAKHVHCKLNNNDEKQKFKEVDPAEDLHIKLKQLEEEKLCLEEKNKHLVLHLEEILTANQNMVSEREALIAQNIADVKKLQEDTLCWKERYEECAAKLELMDKSLDPRLIEAQDTIATLKRTISILQQEKASHAKLIDVATSTYSPFRNKSCPLVTNEGDSLEKDHRQQEYSSLVVMQELNTLRKQLENCLSLQANQDMWEPTQKKLTELQQKLEVEIGKRFTLDHQVKQLMNELQGKVDLEAEIGKMNRRLERDFVSKEEFERVTCRQDQMIGKLQQQVSLDSETKYNEKFSEIDRLLQIQIKEQVRLDKIHSETAISVRRELEDMRLKLERELSTFHAALEAKEVEEKLLRKKCEHLAKEVERIQDLRRKSLIEKSYSINLSDLSPSRIGNGVPQSYTSVPLLEITGENCGETIKAHLEKSLKKHISSTKEIPVEEKLAEELKSKYLKN